MPSLKRQLTLLVLLVVLVPALIVNVLFFFREVRRVQESRRVTAENTVARIVSGYDAAIAAFYQARQAVTAHTLQWIEASADDPSPRALRSFADFERLLSTVDTSVPFVSGISVIDLDQERVATSRNGYQRFAVLSDALATGEILERPGEERFIGPRRAEYSRASGGAYPELYSYYLWLNLLNDPGANVVLQIDIPVSSFEDLLSLADEKLFEMVSIIAPWGEVISYGTNGAGPSIHVSAAIPGSNWRIEATALTPSVLEAGSQVSNVTVLLAMLILLYAYLMSLTFSRRIASPVRHMGEELSVIRTGESGREVTIPRTRELADIAVSVNDMLAGLRDLHEEVVEWERSQHYAQIAALQAMIQPHFLFNTLDTIRGLSLSGETRLAAEAAKNLSTIFRYAVDGGEYYSSLGQELDVAREFLKLQRSRFGERINVIIEVPESVGDVRVPRLILQPLLENVFKHAVTRSKEQVEVRLAVHEDAGWVTIVVVDDGPGFEALRLEEIRDQLRLPIDNSLKTITTGAHGLANVHNRLLLVYGNEAGLTVNAAPEKGAVVAIRIPRDFHGGDRWPTQ